MSLRVNPDLSSNLLAGLAFLREQEARALQSLASGRRVHSLADDPAAIASAVYDRTRISALENSLANLSGLRAGFRMADAALGTAVEVLSRAIALGIQGANGTMSPENRGAVAEEVRGLKEQLLSVANSSSQGNYLFAGTAVTAAPFVRDSSSPSGVRYVGNENVNSVEVTEGQFLPVNIPGGRLFSDPPTDAFLALEHLILALEGGSGVEEATAEVQAAFQNLNTRRSYQSGTMARWEQAETFLNAQLFELRRHETELVGADLTKAASNLAQAEAAKNGVLAATGRITQLSLLDFLQ